MKYPTPLSEFLNPVINDTNLKRRELRPEGVTSLVIVLPPSLVRSLAMPLIVCDTVTYTIDSTFDHDSCHPNNIPNATSCTVNPDMSVVLMPHRAPNRPAVRLVTTPANS